MIKIYLMPGMDPRYAPIPAPLHKTWWQDNDKTRNHAQHCLPLSMANSLGYHILSPVTFKWNWCGDVQKDAIIEVIEALPSCSVDAHAAYGSFTIQPGFIPQTEKPGDFIMIKNIANERGQPFTCMEALIESWWTPANFGLVFLLNQPGRGIITIGQPIAQMCVYRQEGGEHGLQVINELPPGHQGWSARRHRPGYNKDLDYLKGKHHDGSSELTHLSAWQRDR
jgi:hypothetical protein